MPPARHPGRKLLLRRLQKVARLADTLTRSIRDDAAPWRTDVDAYFTVGDKAVIETGLLLLVARRVPAATLSPLLRQLTDQLAPLVFTPRNQSLLMRYPQTAVPLGIPIAALRESGTSDVVFDALIQSAFRSDLTDGFERLPHRALEVQWMRHVLTGVKRSAGVESTSIVTSNANPIYMTTPDFYALSHAAMFATHLGFWEPPYQWRSERVSGLVEASISWCIASANFDLLGELLLTAAVLPGCWSPAADVGWQVLWRTWEALGYLPSPTFQGRAESADLDGEAVAIAQLYHTQYVGGILISVLLTSPEVVSVTSISPRGVDVAQACRRAIDVACAAVMFAPDIASGPGHDVESASPAARRIALGQLAVATLDAHRHHKRVIAAAAEETDWSASSIIDGALIQACRAYRLGSLLSLLTACVRAHARISWSMLASVEFLLRQQQPDGLFGAASGPAETRKTLTRAAVPVLKLIVEWVA